MLSSYFSLAGGRKYPGNFLTFLEKPGGRSVVASDGVGSTEHCLRRPLQLYHVCADMMAPGLAYRLAPTAVPQPATAGIASGGWCYFRTSTPAHNPRAASTVRPASLTFDRPSRHPESATCGFADANLQGSVLVRLDRHTLARTQGITVKASA